MGSQHSTARSPSRRNSQGPPVRPLSRIFRPRDSAHHVADDDDAQPVRGPAPAPTQAQETLAPATPSRPRTSTGHMGRGPHLVPRHGLVRAHDPQHREAPPRPQACPQTAQEGAPAADRARCQAVAATSPPAREATAPAARSASPGASVFPLPLAVADPVPASTSAADGLDALRPQTPATATTPAASAPAVAAELPAVELPQLDQQRPVLAPPTLSSRSSTFTTAPSTPTPVPASPTTPTAARIPRTVALGTTMIVQGLVQTIEVSRPPPPFPTTPPAEVSDHVMPSEPIRQSQDSAHAKPSNPTIAGGDAPAPATGLSTPSTPSSSTSSASSSASPTTTPPDTPPSIASAPSNPISPASSPSPIRASQSSTGSSTPPPSSIDVLGLLLSIAAQATAEALVPWSVPPRSRNLSPSPPSGTGRDGIANGLAAAFSALAAGGAGARASTSTSTSAGTQTETAESAVAVETSLPTPTPTVVDPTPVPAPEPVPVVIPRPRPVPPRTSSFSRRLSTFSGSRRTSIISNRRASTIEPREEREGPRRRTMSMLGDTVRRFMPWRSGAERAERGGTVEEVADFARAPPSPSPIMPAGGTDIPVRSETPVVPTPVTVTPSELASPPSSTSLPPPPVPTFLPPPPVPTSLPPPPIPSPPPRPRPRSHPTTDAEDLVRFSHMLGFTPGAVHPTGSFERFLADMQDELRSALSEYQERTRVRSPERRRRSRATSRDSRRSSREGGRSRDGEQMGSRDGERRASRDGERRASRDWDVRSSLEEEPEPSVSMDRMDHNRPHVPSTDPLPLNWWRMYRFPSLPDVTVPASGSPASTVTIGESTPTSPSTAPTTPSPSTIPGPRSDAEPPVPVHPAIIIGLRSVSRDPLDDVIAGAGTVPGGPGTRRSAETRRNSAGADAGVDAEPRRSSMGDAPWARRFGLRDRDREEAEDRRLRDGTRNYIIWIIGGYYPSNHPLLAHPNLFLGQVHPDELWMLNEFLGQVKPPTASREDIAKAGLRVIKGAQVEEYAKNGNVTENCTERCLVCLDDYADEQDLRIMSCKHMFHKDCVDRWMETGRNNCPACRTKGVDTSSSSSPSPSTSNPPTTAL